MILTTRSPSAHTTSRLIQDSLDAGHVLSIIGRCTVDYEGRTQRTLDPGERIVVCKPDGTLLVHQPTGHKPVS